MENRNTLDILLESISDKEWSEIKLKVDVKRSHEASKIFRSKRESAIKFGDWILKHTLTIGTDESGSFCWIDNRNEDSPEYLTSTSLYNIYIRGDWDYDEEDYDDEEELDD
jgi:hypothetical protein